MAGGCDVPRSHAEIVAAMPAYAAGILTGRVEDVVRRHLAGGCRACLDSLFRDHVGLARVELPASSPGGALSVVTSVLLVIALTGTVLASTIWLAAATRPRDVTGPDDGDLVALEARASALQDRLAALGARSTSLEADLEPLARGWDDARTSERAGAMRPRATRATSERSLAQLGAALSLFGSHVERLHSDEAAHGTRGWLIWDPVHGRLFVYAVGLPRLSAPWEARVTDGVAELRLPLRRLVDGSLWGILDRTDALTCGVRVTIVPPGADRTVLAGALAACDGRPRA